MTILIDIHYQDWMDNADFRKEVSTIPDDQIRFYPDLGDPLEIRMLASDALRSGLLKQLPNLELIQKLGAGVDTMMNDPDLRSNIKIARLRHTTTALEMARFCLAFVLKDVQNLTFHEKNQQQSLWKPKAPKRVADLKVGVLGLGHIGGETARLFSAAGFKVSGWSRSPKEMPGVTCVHGSESFNKILEDSDYISSVLPSTADTENLFNMDAFQRMKSKPMLINVGRGTLIDEDDLITALDQRCLRHAVLDVCRHEPLASDSPLWQHPGITITPHVSGWDLDDGLNVVSENYFRLLDGNPIVHEINRDFGY